MTFDDEMMRALEADGEKLRAMTGEDHGPWDIGTGCIECGADLPSPSDAVCSGCLETYAAVMRNARPCHGEQP